MILREKAAVGFDRGSVNSLAERIEKLRENPELRVEMATRAESLGSGSLSWSRLAEQSIALYLR